jgi:hypothetical protein
VLCATARIEALFTDTPVRVGAVLGLVGFC